jgi:ribosomal protein L17
VQEAINQENLFKKLRLTHIIMHSINLTEKKANELHKRIEEMLTDIDFMRKLKLNSKIKDNDITAIEYLGKDYRGGDENMVFDAEFESILTELEKRIDEYLGMVLTELTKGEDDIKFTA